MISQTKQAYKALLASGLKRGEFLARTPRRTFMHKEVAGVDENGLIWRKRRVFEYDNVVITLLINKERAIELIPTFLENGLDVTLYRKGDKVYIPHLSLARGDIGTLREIDFA